MASEFAFVPITFIQHGQRDAMVKQNQNKNNGKSKGKLSSQGEIKKTKSKESRIYGKIQCKLSFSPRCKPTIN